MGHVDNEMCGWGSVNDDMGFDEDNEMCGWGTLDEIATLPKEREPRDPLFYHIWINYVSALGESEKAYHIKYTDNLNIWVPKSICRDVTDDGMHVHREIFFELKARAKEAMSVPKTFRKPRIFK